MNTTILPQTAANGANPITLSTWPHGAVSAMPYAWR